MSQSVLAVLINDVEPISCMPNIINPHSVSTPSLGTAKRLVWTLGTFDSLSFRCYLRSSKKKSLRNSAMPVQCSTSHYVRRSCTIVSIPSSYR